MTYTVKVDDNFNPGDIVTHGSFDTAAQAITACEKIVADSIEPMRRNNRTADEIYEHYCLFGADPFIESDGSPAAGFNAREFAKKHLRTITD